MRDRAFALLLAAVRVWRPKHGGRYFAFHADEELERGETNRAVLNGRAAVACDSTSALTHLALAHAHEAAGRVADARRACEEGIRLSRDRPALTLALGRLLRAGGEDEQAVAVLRALVRDRPTCWAASRGLSAMLRDQGRSEEAAQVLADHRAHVPDDPRALGVRASRLLELGRDDEALPLLERQSELWPDDAVLHSHIAQFLRKRRETVPAREHARRARDLQPNDDYFSWLADELERDAGAQTSIEQS